MNLHSKNIRGTNTNADGVGRVVAAGRVEGASSVEGAGRVEVVD